MSDEPIWFTAGQIESLNAEIVSRTGEDHVVLSRELLESALARPQNLYAYEGQSDLFVLAARLIEAIGKNHCFLQGNKRTAFNAGVAFLRVNGVRITVDTQEMAETAEGVILGACHADPLIALLRAAALP